MKNQMRKWFKRELERSLRRRMKITWWQCNKEVLTKMIEDNSNHLAQLAVFCKDFAPEHFLALQIGGIELENTALFYKDGAFYRSVKARDSQDDALLVEPCSFEATWVPAVLKFLDDKISFHRRPPREMEART